MSVIRNVFCDDYSCLTNFPYLGFGELIDNDAVWINIMFVTVYLLMNTC